MPRTCPNSRRSRRPVSDALPFSVHRKGSSCEIGIASSCLGHPETVEPEGSRLTNTSGPCCPGIGSLCAIL
ncbi:hypothetical protein DOTSEDRAFT_74150 [Dothistroma septosporum NZE10]|uniref:Uncharacterized protein n=1 Tax=Dothistroma septosporum (strain NZE10 / CBS 128990) TaxID=675120 RepID=N1PED3_DOTSN|nr:hypothetical protein DOTSEDRAFT_74150 [Dothistroma septosporum NZE10]